MSYLLTGLAIGFIGASVVLFLVVHSINKAQDLEDDNV